LRKRYKEEIDSIIKHADIGHIYKSTENKMNWADCKNGLRKRTVKRITDWRLLAVSRIGRPSLRWEIEVRERIWEK